MKTNVAYTFICLWTMVALQLCSCKKSSFLDEVPDRKMVIPSNLSDYERLIRNDLFYRLLLPTLSQAASDDYYLLDNSPLATIDEYKNVYTWNDAIYSGAMHMNWSGPYQAIFYANSVLEGMEKLPVDSRDAERKRQVIGEASFHRAHVLFHLAQTFAPHYTAPTANTALGLPLRLTADVTEPIRRSTLYETYQQIISDATAAVSLLAPFRGQGLFPSKEAAQALLARMYFTIGDYPNALQYADSCLAAYGTLMEYHLIDSNRAVSFAQLNPEVIFHTTGSITGGIMYLPSNSRVSTDLHESYEMHDLRRTLVFKDEKPGYTFRGSYDGSQTSFFGLATDEQYLIKAECLAHLDRLAEAVKTLNHLRSHRYHPDHFIPIGDYTDKGALLQLIWDERRKELPFRGLRWIDLRRLNAMGIPMSLERELDGQRYTLPAGDPRWTFLIPDQVISLNPDIIQNRR